MKVLFQSLLVILTLAMLAMPASAQSCPDCNTPLCDGVCLDDLTCTSSDGEVVHLICYDGLYPACPVEGTPIVIDTKNQGFHLTSMFGGVEFTFGHQLLQTSWTDPNYSNAWLALDRNGNGTIDDVSELFGNWTPQPPGPSPNGYKALAVFDDPKNGGNGNGKIDSGDAIWPSLRLWIDRNHNGISEPGELYPLSELGIFAISLNYTLSEKTDQYGNEFRYMANIQDKYGHQDPLCYDVLLMTTLPGLIPANGSTGQIAKGQDAGATEH